MVQTVLHCIKNIKTTLLQDIEMNEKLKKYKDRAGVFDNPDQEGLDIFAELIIKEVDSIIQQYLMMKVAPTMLGAIVKQHFGIK